MHGALFVPIILQVGSDKTTVSVATGHNEYWPLYASIGNIHNNIRRAHGDGVVLIGFLSIPKSMSLYLFCDELRRIPNQLTKLKLGLSSSDSFGESYSTSPCHWYWSRFVLVRRSLKFSYVPIDVIDV